MARIVEVGTTRVTTALHTPFVTALRRTTALTSVVVRLTDSDGRNGYGEAPQVWRVTGESMTGIEACVLGPLAELLLGWELERPAGELTAALGDTVVANTGAKAACEVAAADLVARASGVSLHRMLGATTSSILTDVTVAADASPSTTHGQLEQGFRHLKVKVGVDPGDVERVLRIHDLAPAPVRIRIDANQAWDVGLASSAMTDWLQAGVDIEFLEQPLHRNDLAGHAELRSTLPVPVMLDESVFSPDDLRRALDAEALDLLNIKLAKCGGLRAGLELARIAREGGVDVMVGSMMESHLGVAAAAALAAVIAPDAVHDVDAAWWSLDPATTDDSPYRADRFLLSEAPGLSWETRDLDAAEWEVRA